MILCTPGRRSAQPGPRSSSSTPLKLLWRTPISSGATVVKQNFGPSQSTSTKITNQRQMRPIVFMSASHLRELDPRRRRVVGPGLDVDRDALELLAEPLHHALDGLGLEGVDGGLLGQVLGVELPGELLGLAD